MQLWKKLLIIPPLLVGVVLLAWMARGRSEPERRAEGEFARPVRVLTLAPRDVVPRAIAYGTVRPSKTWVATAEIAGRVLSLSPLLNEGEIVSAGTELIRIDDTDQNLEVARLTAEAEGLDAQIRKLDQSKANYEALLEVERSSLTLAETEWARLKGLAEKRTISVAEADAQGRQVLAQRSAVVTIENGLALIPSERGQLEAQLKATRARIRRAERDAERAIIRAPFVCRIESVDVEATQPVAPGQRLAVAFDVGMAEIDARIGIEQASHLFRPTDREDVVRGLTQGIDWARFGLTATIRLRLPGRTYAWEGRFARAAPTLSSGTRAAGIVIAVDKPFEKAGKEGHPPLVKGMFVEVELKGPAHRDRLVIPRFALHQGSVYIVDDENRLRIVPVEVDFVQEREAILRGGLEAGARVVVTDLIPAVEGMLLSPAAEDATR